MFQKGALLKVLVFLFVLGLLGLGTMKAMAYYNGFGPVNWKDFPKSIYEDMLDGPAAPEITDQKVEGVCGARIWWWDNELNEDNVYFYRRVVNQPNFIAIEVNGPHVGQPGSFDDVNLPVGVYEYKVGVKNKNGEAFSDVSDPVEIVSEECGNQPLPAKPLNPVIISLERINGNECAIRIVYQDNSLDEDGLRIYREAPNVNDWPIIAELPPNNAPTGYYDDTNLTPWTYRYLLSAFNQNGESFSQISDEFKIDSDSCKKLPLINLPTPPPLQATNTPAPLQPPNQPQACIWKAAINVFVRTGPGASLYPEITAVVADTTFPIVGQSEDEQFWVVQVDAKTKGYVPKAGKFGSTDGDCNPPIVNDPMAPAGSRQQPPNTSIPQCEDGVDNDGDGVIDMRDRGCAARMTQANN